MPLSSTYPIAHRRRPTDDNENDQCHFCNKPLNRGKYYTLMIVQKWNSDGIWAFGICETCTNAIAMCSTLR